MVDNGKYRIPSPVIDLKEIRSVELSVLRYRKLTKPDMISRAGKAAVNLIPSDIKKTAKGFLGTVSETELYHQAMSLIANAYENIENKASEYSVNEHTIIEKVNGAVNDNRITELDEICLARGYTISQIIGSFKFENLLYAVVGGVSTGALGMAGLPFDLVLSTFLYYRAVQSVAMFYGFDVKNNSSELVLVSEIFIKALGEESKSRAGYLVDKILCSNDLPEIKKLIGELEAEVQKTAENAIAVSGSNDLENLIFSGIFRHAGDKITREIARKVIPFVSSFVGVYYDVIEMRKTINLADVFYNKRFIAEKEERIRELTSK